jgi:putative ABC transport system permease protein
MDIVVRAHVEPASLTSSIRREVLAMDATMPFYDVHTLVDAVDESLAARRLTNDLLMAFAIAALILAAVGIYGVMALDVGQRIHEFGIRVALGASTRDVVSLVVGQGMRLAILGAALGLAAALALTRYLEALLFNVRPTDPLTFAGVAALLVIVALAACLIPARRATSTPPVVALRAQ